MAPTPWLLTHEMDELDAFAEAEVFEIGGRALRGERNDGLK